MLHWFLILCLLFLSLAHADKRIVVVDYDPNKVITLWCDLENTTMVEFEKDEEVKSAIVGFAPGWSVIQQGNTIVVQPKKVRSQLMFADKSLTKAFNTLEANNALTPLKKKQPKTKTKQDEILEKTSSKSEQKEGGLKILKQDFDLNPDDLGWRTNLMVRTNKAIYEFELRIASVENFNAPVWLVRLRYKDREIKRGKILAFLDQEKRKRERATALHESMVNKTKYISFILNSDKDKQVVQEKREQIIKKIKMDTAKALATDYIKDALEHGGVSVPRNYNYYFAKNKNSRQIEPSIVYDDGRFTYLAFKPIKQIPAFFIKRADGREEIVNYHTNEDENYTWIVIHTTTPTLYLRKDKQLIAIVNRSYNVNPVNKNFKMENHSDLKRIVKSVPIKDMAN